MNRIIKYFGNTLSFWRPANQTDSYLLISKVDTGKIAEVALRLSESTLDCDGMGIDTGTENVTLDATMHHTAQVFALLFWKSNLRCPIQ